MLFSTPISPSSLREGGQGRRSTMQHVAWSALTGLPSSLMTPSFLLLMPADILTALCGFQRENHDDECPGSQCRRAGLGAGCAQSSRAEPSCCSPQPSSSGLLSTIVQQYENLRRGSGGGPFQTGRSHGPQLCGGDS